MELHTEHQVPSLEVLDLLFPVEHGINNPHRVVDVSCLFLSCC